MREQVLFHQLQNQLSVSCFESMLPSLQDLLRQERLLDNSFVTYRIRLSAQSQPPPSLPYRCSTSPSPSQWGRRHREHRARC